MHNLPEVEPARGGAGRTKQRVGNMPIGSKLAIGFCTVALLLGSATAPGQAEAIKVGTLKQAPYGVVSIAQQKGYFAAEGLDVDIVTFDLAEPVPVGVVSGDLAFGIVGTSASLRKARSS